MVFFFFFYNLSYLEPQAIDYKLDYTNKVIFHLRKETISLYKIILHTCDVNKNNLFSYNLEFLFPFFFFLLFLRWIFLYFQVLPILMSISLGYVGNFNLPLFLTSPMAAISVEDESSFSSCWWCAPCLFSTWHYSQIFANLNYRSSSLVVCLPTRCKPQVQYLTLWASNKKNK